MLPALFEAALPLPLRQQPSPPEADNEALYPGLTLGRKPGMMLPPTPMAGPPSDSAVGEALCLAGCAC